jgi:hypothetical protein
MDKASIAMRSSSEFSDTLAAPLASEIDELAERSESLEQRIASLNDSYETLKKREVELTEWRWVLREAGGFFDRVSTNFLRKGSSNAYADIENRPTPRRKTFANPSTTTRRLFSVMSSSTLLVVQTVIPLASRASRR